MKILGLETSCDETAAAIVEDGIRVLANVIASSKSTFENSAGVIPEEAARQQINCILPVIEQALIAATMAPPELDALAVTFGPGLLGSLLVGTTTARALASLWKKPLIGVHHTLGHLSSPWLECDEDIAFPVLTLSASGGHTELWLRTSHTRGRLIGSTRDDAAGEAFDKGASILGLPYPGGPAIETCAKQGNIDAFHFPEPMKGDVGYSFSFSGLKTSLKYTVRDLKEPLEKHRAHLAASYQHALCTHLVTRIRKALQEFQTIREVHVVGGVSANGMLRAMLQDLPVPVRMPARLRYCTDNAAMIASAGFFLKQEQGTSAFLPFTTKASVPLEEALIP